MSDNCFNFELYKVSYPFISTWRIPFSISCRVGTVAINSLSLCLFGYILITPSLLKDILLVIEFLVKSFFFFRDFEYFNPLPSGLQGFLCLSRLSLCLPTVWLYHVCCASFGGFPIGVWWASWISRFMFFIKFGRFLVIIFSNVVIPVAFSLLLWVSHNMYASLLDNVTEVP